MKEETHKINIWLTKLYRDNNNTNKEAYKMAKNKIHFWYWENKQKKKKNVFWFSLQSAVEINLYF